MGLVENLYRNAIQHCSEDERKDVFELGYSTAPDGTGFGLNIVKQVADTHGWDIRVTEGSAGGARFEITGAEFAKYQRDETSGSNP